MSTDARHHYLAEFARIADGLPGVGVPWLDRLRTTALDEFAQRGFPTKRDEEWKYTRVGAFEQQAFVVMPESHAAADANALVDRVVERLTFGNATAHVLVFHNGRYAPTSSSVGKLPAGVTLMSVAETLNTAPEALEPYLASEDRVTAFGLLNAAFMADGAYLHLRRGTALELPVHLLFVSTNGGASHARNVIVAEEGSRATVIEHYVGLDDASYFTNTVTRIFAAANADIAHHKLQQEGVGAFHIARIDALQQRDSRLESHAFSFGAALARNDITTAFAAPGCEATLNGLYLVDGQQHVDHHTRIDHRQPNGTSREHYRGVLGGRSHAVFNGKVIVQPGAQKTNAFQANHNLLLSRDAEIDTKPELEIYADDVKCNHGATVGQLDEAQLFYLRSRSIDETVARNLLVHAFAHDIIEGVRVTSLRTRLEQILLTRLPQDDRIGELP